LTQALGKFREKNTDNLPFNRLNLF